MCKLIDMYKAEVGRLTAPFSKGIKDILFATPEDAWYWQKLSWATTPLAVLYCYNNIIKNVFEIKEYTPSYGKGLGDGYFTVTYNGHTEYYYAFYKEIQDSDWFETEVKRINIQEFAVYADFKHFDTQIIFQGKKEIAEEYLKNYHNEWCNSKWIMPCLWKVADKWYSNLHDAKVAANALDANLKHIKDL